MTLSVDGRILEDMLSALQLEVTVKQKNSLLIYTELLLEGLKKQRLTGEKTAEGIINKQLFDSLYPLKILTFPGGSKIIDLGTGAGLPGIPLKIFLPEVFVYLLDANKRKINFLQLVSGHLGLDKVSYLPVRAEELAHRSDHRENYDYVLSKAVAETAVLAELALPMLKIGGQVLLYKGSRGDQEAERASRAISICGGSIEKAWYYKLPTGEKRSLYLIGKVKETPPQYPRSTGKPARKPLL